MRVVEPRIIRADGSILEDLNSRSGTIRPLGSLLRFKTLGGLNIRTHDRTSVLQSGPAGIATITVLFLVVFFTLQEASGTDGASLPARFRGDYENLRARFTNVREKVEETRGWQSDRAFWGTCRPAQLLKRHCSWNRNSK